MLRDLMTILTEYEGAIQEDDDECSEESAENLQNPRNELLDILRIAVEWEKSKQTQSEARCKIM